MRVSQHFSLKLTQPSLDFVDVDTTNDVRLFVDPRALRLLPSAWGQECVALVQDFFEHVLNLIKASEDAEAQRLLGHLNEPNETHLGLSRAKSQGRGMGVWLAHEVWEGLRKSGAVKSGLLQELEDTALMVEGIAADIISDITTNIIRDPLIAYTQDACMAYGIPTGEVASGPLWDPREKTWHNELVELPVVDDRKLLLVPKYVVRHHMDYDQEEYYRDYILEQLREEEIAHDSSLVTLLKNGRPRVTKKDLEAKYGRGKSVIVRETLRNPKILEKYRHDKESDIQGPLDHFALSSGTDTALPDFEALLTTLLVVAPGKNEATDYEKAVGALLAALFYPSLAEPNTTASPARSILDQRSRVES